MTNKEQVTELSNVFIEGPFKHGYYLGAMKMAELKDQQFKEYLEKEREELLEQIKKLQSRGVGYDNFEECYTYMAAKLLRIIEKLFGGE